MQSIKPKNSNQGFCNLFSKNLLCDQYFLRRGNIMKLKKFLFFFVNIFYTASDILICLNNTG